LLLAGLFIYGRKWVWPKILWPKSFSAVYL
jgi:hypothetical protein